MRSFAALVAAFTAFVAFVALPATASAEEEKLPVPWSLLAGVTAQLADPDSPPPGANDCRVSPAPSTRIRWCWCMA